MLTRVPAARSQPPAVLPGRTATRTQWPSGVAKYVVPEIVFGAGVLDEIGHAAARLGAVRPLLVTDAGVQEAGWSGQAWRHLRDSGPVPTAWSAVTPDPKDVEVLAGTQAYLEAGCDVIVAVGGGSDACLSTNPRPVTEDDVAGILRAAL